MFAAFVRSSSVGLTLASMFFAPACDSAEDQHVECCILIEVANHCDGPSVPESTREAAKEWRTIGLSNDRAACQGHSDENAVGCTEIGASERYDESDALVECNRKGIK